MVSPTTDRRFGLVGNTPMKAPVTALASSNISQSGQQTVDGVSLLASNSAGVPDRVLCTGQSDATKNGIWDVSTAAWTRSSDADGKYDFCQGSTVLVNQGAVNSGTYWRLTTSGVISIGTTALTWTQALASALTTVTFTQAGTGAVSRNGQTKMREVMSVMDFGCVGNNVTDDAANFQFAINQAVASGVPLYVPFGNYKIGTALTVTGALTMYGAGDGLTFINANTTTQDVFSVATDSPMNWRDLSITGKTTATAGALLRLSGSASQNLYSNFNNVRFMNGWDQLLTVKAAAWSCYFCKFFSPVNSGASLENDFNTDGGDMGIFNCDFIGGSHGVAVQQFSAGGLRFIGNKVVQWAIGYQCSLLSGVNTSDLFIQGCSFESQSNTHIIIGKGAGVGFGAVHIVGNEINNAVNGITLTTDSGPWLNIVNIAHNEIANTTGSSIIIQGTQNFSVADNVLSGTGVGINVGTVVSGGSIHDNRISGFATPIAGTLTGKSLTIHGNDGYNPVGASALTPSASPYTLTNGATPATVYLAAATSITALTIGGVSILPAATGANVNYTLQLGPNEAAVITYTGALTAKQMVH